MSIFYDTRSEGEIDGTDYVDQDIEGYKQNLSNQQQYSIFCGTHYYMKNNSYYKLKYPYTFLKISAE